MTGMEEGSPTLLVAITVAVAAVAVLAAIVVVAVGGGGELSVEHPDHPPLALPGRRPAAGTDVLLLRLPLGLWGYHKQITDEALDRFSHELTERDTRIAVLEQQLAEARQQLYGKSAEPPNHRALPPPPVTREEAVPALADQNRYGVPPGQGDPLATRTDATETGFAPPDTYAPEEPPTDRWSTISDDRDGAERPEIQGPPSNPWWRTPEPEPGVEVASQVVPEDEPESEVDEPAKADKKDGEES
jgi:hypothetical protein